MADISAPALDDEGRQGANRFGGRAERSEHLVRVLDEIARPGARDVETVERRVRHFLFSLVTARRLSQFGETALDIENIIDDLKGESEIVAGHGLFRRLGYLSVSAQDQAELETASGEIEALAQRSQLEVARLSGQHDQAFGAAALPLARGLR